MYEFKLNFTFIIQGERISNVLLSKNSLKYYFIYLFDGKNIIMFSIVQGVLRKRKNLSPYLIKCGLDNSLVFFVFFFEILCPELTFFFVD